MTGKVTGIGTAKIKQQDSQEAALRQAAIAALVDHYAAPDGEEGDAERLDADRRYNDATSQADRRLQQAADLRAIQDDAQRAKEDLLNWLKLVP